MTTSSVEIRGRASERFWLAGSLALAVLLGVTLVFRMKVALAGTVLLLGVALPVLVIGVRLRATLLVLMLILYLAPAIRIAEDLPVLMGDEALIFITAILMLGTSVIASPDEERWPGLPSAGKALLLFFPLTMLTIANGAARFGINPIRGDYFEFVKFGKYVLAIYIASCVRIDRRYLVAFSWVTAIGAFGAAFTAILQSFNIPGVREVFELVYYSANPAKVGGYLGERAAGTIGNPNELALFIVAGLVFALTLLQLEKHPGHRLVLWMFVGADLLAVLLSGSRMGMGTAFVGVLLVVFRSPRRKTALLMVAAAAALVLLLVVLGVAERNNQLPGFLAGALHPLFNRAERLSSSRFVDIFARMQMWHIAWSQTRNSLLLGYGPAKGALDLLTSKTTDSEIFIMALRYGLVGLATWIGIWVVFMRTGRRAARSSDRTFALVGQALWASLVVNLLATTVNYTFLALRRMTLVCVFVGLAAAISRADDILRARTAGAAPDGTG